jgi:hypothetical protein
MVPDVSKEGDALETSGTIQLTIKHKIPQDTDKHYASYTLKCCTYFVFWSSPLVYGKTSQHGAPLSFKTGLKETGWNDVDWRYVVGSCQRGNES